MNIAVVTAFNDRPQISQIFLNNVKRWREEIPEHRFRVLVGVNSDNDKDLSFKYGHCAHRSDSNKAGLKFNEVIEDFTTWISGLPAIEQWTPDYFLLTGDDDAISSDYIREALAIGKDHMGLKSNLYYNTETGECMRHEYMHRCDKLIGAGRLVSFKAMIDTVYKTKIRITRGYFDGVVEYVKDKEYMVSNTVANYLEGYHYAQILEADIYVGLYQNRQNQGLDHTAEMRLVANGYVPYAVKMKNEHIIDFKSGKNIWPYSILEAKCTKFEGDPFWFMTEKEIEYVKSLQTK